MPRPANRYLAPDAALIAEDLANAGLRGPEPGAMASALLGFLGNTAQQVTLAEQLALCDLLDAAHPWD